MREQVSLCGSRFKPAPLSFDFTIERFINVQTGIRTTPEMV